MFRGCPVSAYTLDDGEPEDADKGHIFLLKPQMHGFHFLTLGTDGSVVSEGLPEAGCAVPLSTPRIHPSSLQSWVTAFSRALSPFLSLFPLDKGSCLSDQRLLFSTTPILFFKSWF